jgi:hypothetical protein
MTEHLEIQVGSYPRNSDGGPDIGFARRRIPTRVVVDNRERLRAELLAAIENVIEGDRAARDITARRRIDRQELHMLVGVKHEQPFVSFLTEAFDIITNSLRPPDVPGSEEIRWIVV